MFLSNVCAKLLFQFFHEWSRMLKETLIPKAKVVQARLSVFGFGKAISRAFPMAGKLPLALLALCGQSLCFHVCKSHLLFAIQHIQNAAVAYVAQKILREYKVVATVYVSVVLHYCGMPTPI
jgi:hypothetical protein